VKIERIGHSANHGIKELKVTSTKVTWKPMTDSVAFRAMNVRDFDSAARHNYTVSISLEECAEVIKLLGGELARKSPDKLAAAMSPALLQLLRLVNVCVDTEA
jgi:hypothetical protein